VLKQAVFLAALAVVVTSFSGFAGVIQEGSVSLLSLQEPECNFEGPALVPAVGSFVLPGLGQFLNGQTNKGILHFGVALVPPAAAYLMSSLFLATGSGMLSPVLGLLPALQLGWHAYSAWDAYSVSGEFCAPAS